MSPKVNDNCRIISKRRRTQRRREYIDCPGPSTRKRRYLDRDNLNPRKYESRACIKRRRKMRILSTSSDSSSHLSSGRRHRPCRRECQKYTQSRLGIKRRRKSKRSIQSSTTECRRHYSSRKCRRDYQLRQRINRRRKSKRSMSSSTSECSGTSQVLCREVHCKGCRSYKRSKPYSGIQRRNHIYHDRQFQNRYRRILAETSDSSEEEIMELYDVEAYQSKEPYIAQWVESVHQNLYQHLVFQNEDEVDNSSDCVIIYDSAGI